MFNMEVYKQKVNTDYESPAWALLEKVIKALENESVDAYFVQHTHVPQAYDKEADINTIGSKYLHVSILHRHNATEVNVSVRIDVVEKTGEWKYTRLARIKVPKDASDKVIKNRVAAALTAMAQ